MSLSEVAIITLVGLFVLKPNDLKQLARSFKNLVSYASKIKQEIFDSITEDESEEDKERINNYLAKIIKLSGKYEGKYDLPSVKAHYHKLIINQHKEKKNVS